MAGFGRRRKDMMPITMASAGESVKIVRISGRDEMKCHLRDLGFVENTEITVVAKNGGNMILLVKDGRVAIDQALAQRIMY